MFDSFKKEDLQNVKRLRDFFIDRNISIESISDMIKVERFKIRDIQNLFTIIDLLKNKEKSFDDFDDILIEYFKNQEEKIKEERKNNDKKMIQKPCPTPDCKGFLLPYSGNDEGGEGIWGCKICRYSEYDGRNVSEMRKDLISED